MDSEVQENKMELLKPIPAYLYFQLLDKYKEVKKSLIWCYAEDGIDIFKRLDELEEEIAFYKRTVNLINTSPQEKVNENKM